MQHEQEHATATAIFDYSLGAEGRDVIELLSSDGRRFSVNKVALSLLSPVFKTMFADANDTGEPLVLEETAEVLNIIMKAGMIPEESPLARGTTCTSVNRAIDACDKYLAPLPSRSIQLRAS